MANTEIQNTAPVEEIALSNVAPLSSEEGIPSGTSTPDGDSGDEAAIATPVPARTEEGESNVPPAVNPEANPAEFFGWRPRGPPTWPTVVVKPHPKPSQPKPSQPTKPTKPYKPSKTFDSEGGVM